MATLIVAIHPPSSKPLNVKPNAARSLSTTRTGILVDSHDEQTCRRLWAADLMRLIARTHLGEIGKSLLRDEIYEERTWPRSRHKHPCFKPSPKRAKERLKAIIVTELIDLFGLEKKLHRQRPDA